MTDRCQELIDSFYSDWSIVLMLICEKLLVLEASGKLGDTELLYSQVAVFVLLLKFPFYLFKSWKFSIVLELTVCLGYRFFSMKYLMRIIGPGWWNYRKEWQHKTMKPYIELLSDVFTLDILIRLFGKLLFYWKFMYVFSVLHFICPFLSTTKYLYIYEEIGVK